MDRKKLSKLSIIVSSIFCSGYIYADGCTVSNNNLSCAPNAVYNASDHNNKLIWEYDNVTLSTTENKRNALEIYSYSEHFKM
ncbi:hypothetical protein B9T31_05155 [Acinetobacter sp. ANC 4558]|nr:hypothetical protein B9T31_05155 [Acinetobacter sp. ANC 4558]